MKIKPIKMTTDSKRISINSPISLKTDFKVKRIPSSKEYLDSLVRTYGEKELKRLGVLECKTCSKRKSENDKRNSFEKVNPNNESKDVILQGIGNDKTDSKKNVRKVIQNRDGLSILICPECGRNYIDGGAVDEVKAGDNLYDPSVELFEGIKVDEKI